jgi:hypothetical protein
MANLIPGWNSPSSAEWWSSAWFWASIVSLLLLGVCEVISHRYSERKDELTAQQQEATQRKHDTDIAALQLQTAQANERAVKAQLALEQYKAHRTISAEQQTEMFTKLKRYAGTPFAFSMLPTPEPIALADRMGAVLAQAGWTPMDFPAHGGLKISAPNGKNGGIITSFVGLRIEVPQAQFGKWGAAAVALTDALNAIPGIEASAMQVTPGTESTQDAIAIFVGAKQ